MVRYTSSFRIVSYMYTYPSPFDSSRTTARQLSHWNRDPVWQDRLGVSRNNCTCEIIVTRGTERKKKKKSRRGSAIENTKESIVARGAFWDLVYSSNKARMLRFSFRVSALILFKPVWNISINPINPKARKKWWYCHGLESIVWIYHSTCVWRKVQARSFLENQISILRNLCNEMKELIKSGVDRHLGVTISYFTFLNSEEFKLKLRDRSCAKVYRELVRGSLVPSRTSSRTVGKRRIVSGWHDSSERERAI